MVPDIGVAVAVVAAGARKTGGDGAATVVVLVAEDDGRGFTVFALAIRLALALAVTVAAAVAAPMAAISAPVEPHVGKGGVVSTGTSVAYWKSSASLLKKRSSPASGSSGKGSSSCSRERGNREACAEGRVGSRQRGVYDGWGWGQEKRQYNEAR